MAYAYLARKSFDRGFKLFRLRPKFHLGLHLCLNMEWDLSLNPCCRLTWSRMSWDYSQAARRGLTRILSAVLAGLAGLCMSCSTASALYRSAWGNTGITSIVPIENDAVSGRGEHDILNRSNLWWALGERSKRSKVQNVQKKLNF